MNMGKGVCGRREHDDWRTTALIWMKTADRCSHRSSCLLPITENYCRGLSRRTMTSSAAAAAP